MIVLAVLRPLLPLLLLVLALRLCCLTLSLTMVIVQCVTGSLVPMGIGVIIQVAFPLDFNRSHYESV